MDELEKAHLDYLKRRNEILTKLLTIHDDMVGVYQKWIEQVIDFIKEGEI